MTLLECFAKYRADKTHPIYGPIYTGAYERHLDPKPRSLLEIGIAQGDCLRGWQEWGIPQVYGMDINPVHSPPDNTRIWEGSATDLALARDVVGPHDGHFDVIVDDASHNPNDVMDTFWMYRWKVVPGGWYVIEDTMVMGPSVPDYLLSELQRHIISELHFYSGIVFARRPTEGDGS